MSVSVQSPSSTATSSSSFQPPSPTSAGLPAADASSDLPRSLGSPTLSPPTGPAFSTSFARPAGSTQQPPSRSTIAANPSAHAESHQTQSTSDFLDRIRAQSICAASGSNPALPSIASPGPSMTQLDRQRKSLPASSFSQSRIAQLALLADQAKMAATGTSSLIVARANNMFVDEAVRQAAGQTGEEAKADLSPGDVGELMLDPAWEAAFSSPGFLASASSLAHEFKAQEQTRKEWAGQALALQQRRWTMAPESSTLPSFGAHKRPSASAETVNPMDSIAKRRRVSFDQRDLSLKNRRVSFAKNLISPPSRSSSQLSPLSGAPSSSAVGSGSASASTAPTALSGTSSAARSPPAEFKSALPSGTRRRSSLSSPPESRPQLLANVIASFATLLDTRQQACASLAELARTSDGAMPALSPTATSRPSSPPIGAASLFPNSTGDMSAIAESEGEDSDAMSETSSSDEESELKEISRAEEAATTLQGLSSTWRESAARSIDPKKHITSESSGQASAMKLDSALADVKEDVKVGGRTGIQVRAPDSPDGGKVSARV